MGDNDNSNDNSDPEYQARVEAYEAKVEAKRERYSDRADKARRESASAFESARRIADGIPMGQPILVGHHSEKRHRKDIARIDSGMRRGIEAESKAAHYASKAEGYGTHGVSSDDPAAVVKLRAELAVLEANRVIEKAANAAMRKGVKGIVNPTREDHARIIELLDLPAGIKRQLMSYARAFPWLPQFGNHTSANIRRIEKRIEELMAKDAMPDREPLKGECVDADGKTMGYTVEWNKADNRVQIYFAFKPSADVIAKLKSRGFKWARSVGAWQRQASEGAWYHARWIVGHKEPTTVKVDTCPGCNTPTHASESDDQGRCATCAEAAGEPHVREE